MNSALGVSAHDAKVNPHIVVCYICGRQFSIHSLKIHETQCLAKWDLEESKKPRSERRPPPKRPVEFDMVIGGSAGEDGSGGKAGGAGADADYRAAMQQYNDKMNDVFLNQSRVECQHCGRKFASDRLSVHQRSCTSDHPASSVRKAGADAGGGRAIASATPPAEAAKKHYVATPSPSTPTSKTAAKPITAAVATKAPVPPASSPSTAAKQAPNTATAFCTSCGRKFADVDKFCGSCGLKRT
ncbi:hypothetical protein RI367_000362 [Sorochytrium milnesiophthora]